MRRLTEQQQVELDGLVVNGLLLPARVVQAAARGSSSLHALFTWDDGDAAEHWRLHEARMIIRSYVTVAQLDVKPIQTYVSLSTDRVHGAGYRHRRSVHADPNLRGAYLETALTAAEEFANRFRDLPEWDPVRNAIRNAVVRVRRRYNIEAA